MGSSYSLKRKHKNSVLKSDVFNSSKKFVGKLCRGPKILLTSLTLRDFLLISLIDGDSLISSHKSKQWLISFNSLIAICVTNDANALVFSLSDDLATNISSAMTVLTFEGLL